jgi:hypothetical protein
VESIVTAKSTTLQRLLDLLKVAGAGLTTGLVTPLLQLLIDRISIPPGGFRVALMAVPFAVLVAMLVWRAGRRWWTALLSALITMVAFVCAVNAAILVDGLTFDAGKTIRNALAGFAGGFVGSGLMALGLTPLPGIPARWQPWALTVVFGTMAGALLALDNAVGFEVFSFLYPVWQAVVGVCLAIALNRR